MADFDATRRLMSEALELPEPPLYLSAMAHKLGIQSELDVHGLACYRAGMLRAAEIADNAIGAGWRKTFPIADAVRAEAEALK